MLPSLLPGRYLVVDPGRASGWCLVERGGPSFIGSQFAEVRLYAHGEADSWTEEVENVVRHARTSNAEALVLELPGLGPSLPPATVLGLGAALGAWERAWRLSRGAERSVIVHIPAMTWRSTVLGGGQRPTEEWKAAARAHLRAIGLDIEGNEAPDAVCLAEHALCSLDVADAVGVRRLKQLGWAEPRGCWVDGRFIAAEVA